MRGPTVKSVSLTLGAFVLITFAVQGVSHFGLNAEHYAGISMMRADPIVPLGIAAMLVQGVLAGLLFPLVRLPGGTLRAGVAFGWALGLFLGAYIVLVEPSKYTVPSISSWMGVEAAAAFVQFTLFGAALGFIHRGARVPAPAAR